jgi:hypothetical protein
VPGAALQIGVAPNRIDITTHIDSAVGRPQDLLDLALLDKHG